MDLIIVPWFWSWRSSFAFANGPRLPFEAFGELGVEAFAAGFRDNNQVLNSDATYKRRIETWFDGEGIAANEFRSFEVE